MDAVIPCINRLHMVSNTHANMLRTLGDTLQLQGDPSPAAVTSAVQQLLRRQAMCVCVWGGMHCVVYSVQCTQYMFATFALHGVVVAMSKEYNLFAHRVQRDVPLERDAIPDDISDLDFE